MQYSARTKSLKNRVLLFTVYFVLITVVAPLVYLKDAEAAQFTEAYLRLDRMKASTALAGVVCAKVPTGSVASTEAKVAVTFPSDFTISTTVTDWTVDTTATNLPTGATAWTSIAAPTGGNVSGQTVTFGSGNLASDANLYCFHFVAANSTTGSAGGSKTGTITTKTSGDATIDSSSYATAVISEDSITVTATVPPTFTFAVSFDNDGTGVDAFSGNLDSASVVSTDGTTATVTTNASNGYHIWAKSTNAGLTSATTSQTISSPGTTNDSPESLAAQEGYVLDVDETTDSGTSGSGNLTIDAEYNGSDTNSGGHLVTNFDEIAIADGPTDGDVVTLILRAKPSAIRKAATDYTDTLYVTAAARF